MISEMKNCAEEQQELEKMYCKACRKMDNSWNKMDMLLGGTLRCPICGYVEPLGEMPSICLTCRGPWPECMPGCALFD